MRAEEITIQKVPCCGEVMLNISFCYAQTPWFALLANMIREVAGNTAYTQYFWV
jgi:hypothetical protein